MCRGVCVGVWGMYKPYCTDSALGGRMWAKRALLGGFWPIRTVRACFGGEDARMTSKCGTSMDRAHPDLSAPVHLEYRLSITFDSPPFFHPAAPAPALPPAPARRSIRPASRPPARTHQRPWLHSPSLSASQPGGSAHPPAVRSPQPTLAPLSARAGKGKGQRPRFMTQ